jgi:hypothetical protein
MFGGYDRRVFATTELKTKNGWFDAESLLSHINGKVTNGDPVARYSELARAGLSSTPSPENPSTVVVDRSVSSIVLDRPTRTGNYMTDLYHAALNGVGERDVLFHAYLSPLARALFFRDFYDDPKRDALVIQALMDWLQSKHNGRVSRITKGKTRNLTAVLKHMVRHMHETPKPIQVFWKKVRDNDAKHPRTHIFLMQCMKARLANPFSVTKATLNQLKRLLDEIEEAGDQKEGYTYNSKVKAIASPPTSASFSLPHLPPLILDRLSNHLANLPGLQASTTSKLINFAQNLLQEIGLKGKRRISWQRINEIANLGKSRRHADRYKRILFGAGILLSWKNSGVPKKKPTLYRLSDWVIAELKAFSY